MIGQVGKEVCEDDETYGGGKEFEDSDECGVQAEQEAADSHGWCLPIDYRWRS